MTSGTSNISVDVPKKEEEEEKEEEVFFPGRRCRNEGEGEDYFFVEPRAVQKLEFVSFTIGFVLVFSVTSIGAPYFFFDCFLCVMRNIAGFHAEFLAQVFVGILPLNQVSNAGGHCWLHLSIHDLDFSRCLRERRTSQCMHSARGSLVRLYVTHLLALHR